MRRFWLQAWLQEMFSPGCREKALNDNATDGRETEPCSQEMHKRLPEKDSGNGSRDVSQNVKAHLRGFEPLTLGSEDGSPNDATAWQDKDLCPTANSGCSAGCSDSRQPPSSRDANMPEDLAIL